MPENDIDNNVDAEEVEIVYKKPHPIKRLGCGVLLVLWFTLLLTPCMLFYLAANGEIRIWHSSIPEPNAHPRLLVELVTEIDYRGLQSTRSYVVDSIADDDAICVQTDVSFYLWESIEDDLDTSYCDCYQRDNPDASWVLSETITDVCTNPSG